MPVIFYDIHSKGAESYIQLAKEVIANAQKRFGQGTERTHHGSRNRSSPQQPERASGGDVSGGSGSTSPGTDNSAE